LLHHRCRRQLRKQKAGVEVGLDHPIPVLGGLFENTPKGNDRGVVDQNANRPQRLFDLFAESVDYGGVSNVLRALGSRTARIALMTAIGVTNRTGDYNRATEAHDWKRRSERLVRMSGLPYTIVRPGWFDYNGPDQHRLVLLQGDRRQAGDPSDGVIARRQIAQVLVRSLSSDHALRKTFELIATAGSAQDDFDGLFAPLDADPQGTLDGVHDMANMALEDEPQRVRDDLDAVLAHHSASDGAQRRLKQ
jgi:uncharacterized protein YbjT (DUF2867 family)